MLSAPEIKIKSCRKRPSSSDRSSLSRYSSHHKIVASSPSRASLLALLPGTVKLIFIKFLKEATVNWDGAWQNTSLKTLPFYFMKGSRPTDWRPSANWSKDAFARYMTLYLHNNCFSCSLSLKSHLILLIPHSKRKSASSERDFVRSFSSLADAICRNRTSSIQVNKQRKEEKEKVGYENTEINKHELWVCQSA